MTTTLSSISSAAMQSWRRQVGQRSRISERRGPRPFAVLSYLVRGGTTGSVVPLRRLTLVALFDERMADGELATRLVGVSGALERDGLQFGGPALTRFDKDLRVPPNVGGSGGRLDLTDQPFLSFALGLEKFLERCARHPYVPRSRVPRLPSLETTAAADRISMVDVTTFPKRQIIRLTAPERDLIGCAGTSMFDFVNTRFRVAR